MMGTCNFYKVNAKHTYAVLMNREEPIIDDEGNETDEMESVPAEDWDVENLKECIIEKVKASKKGELYDHTHYIQSEHDNRNFSATAICGIYQSKYWKNAHARVQVNMFYRCGYYEGACLDWEMHIELCDNGQGENTEVDPQDLVYWSDCSEKMAEYLAPKVQKWIEKQVEALTNEAERIFSEVADHTLNKVATFSNGEAVYEKVS